MVGCGAAHRAELPCEQTFVAEEINFRHAMNNPIRTQRQSHLEIIKGVLTRYPNQWIAAPYLAQITGSLAVHSRIADLRRLGFNIINRTEKVFRDGVLVNVSTYSYVTAPSSDLLSSNE